MSKQLSMLLHVAPINSVRVRQRCIFDSDIQNKAALLQTVLRIDYS